MKRPRGTGSLFRKPGSRIWHMKYYRGGVPVRESSGETNKIKAGDKLKDKVSPTLQALTGPRIGKVKISELAEDLFRDYRVNKRRSLAWTERRWKLHLAPVFGQMKARDLSIEDLNRYVDDRTKAEAENATINRELAVLKRAFNLGRKNSKVYYVPAFPSRLEESDARSGFVEDEQYQKLCDYCQGELWLRTALALGYTFGFRKSELLNLRVRQVNLLNRTIVLAPGTTKNKQARTVKLTSETYELLKASLIGKTDDDFVLARGNTAVLRAAWSALCIRAGLPKLLFHDLRRSAVRNMIRRGVQEKVAMKISGHKTRDVFDRYNITNENDLADAAQLIESGAQKFDEPEFGHSLGTDEARQGAANGAEKVLKSN